MTTLNYQGVSLTLDLDPQNPFGIAKIKEAVRFAGGMFQDLKSALSDNRLSWIEGIRLGLGLSGLASLVRGFEQMKEEAKDLTLSELEELADEVILSFGLQVQGDKLALLNDKVLPTLAHVLGVVAIWTNP